MKTTTTTAKTTEISPLAEELYVTVTGLNHYYGTAPFRVGNLLLCKKEHDNRFDDEAIRVVLPVAGTAGYIANSPATTAGGTMSAGRIYDRVGERFFVRVMFTTSTKVICRVVAGDDAAFKDELKKQLLGDFFEDGVF